MPERNDHNKNMKEKIASMVGLTLFVILMIGFVLGVYFLVMAGIFELLGVPYESIWSLVTFVVSFFILGIIVELFTKAIYELSVRNITGKIQVFFIRIMIEGTSNWIVLFTVDEFMNSITLSLNTEIIVALLLAVLEMVFDNKENGGNKLTRFKRRRKLH